MQLKGFVEIPFNIILGLVYLKRMHVCLYRPSRFQLFLLYTWGPGCCWQHKNSFQAFFIQITFFKSSNVFPMPQLRMVLVFTASRAGPAIDLFNPLKCMIQSIYKSVEFSQFIPAFSLCDGFLSSKNQWGADCTYYVGIFPF